MQEVWYKLEDGAIVSPDEVFTRDDGMLEHLSGALVAMRGDVPHTVGVDLDSVAKDAKSPVTREIDTRRAGRANVRRKAN